MAKCYYCGRTFKNKQAVKGHLATCPAKYGPFVLPVFNDKYSMVLQSSKTRKYLLERVRQGIELYNETPTPETRSYMSGFLAGIIAQLHHEGIIKDISLIEG